MCAVMSVSTIYYYSLEHLLWKKITITNVKILMFKEIKD